MPQDTCSDEISDQTLRSGGKPLAQPKPAPCIGAWLHTLEMSPQSGRAAETHDLNLIAECHRILLAVDKPIAPSPPQPALKSYNIANDLCHRAEMPARLAHSEGAKKPRQHPNELPVIVLRHHDTDTSDVRISQSKVILVSERTKFTISGQNNG